MRPQVLYPREMGVELLLICPGWDLAQLLWGAGIPILSGNWPFHTQAACVFQPHLLAAWREKGRKRLRGGLRSSENRAQLALPCPSPPGGLIL